MNERILVVYATKHGATAEIAERIGERIKEAQVSVDVKDVNEVTDLSPYTGVVLGSAVYIGAWRKEAARFLKTHQDVLTQRKVWIFSSGPTGEGDPVELVQGWTLPTKLQPVVDAIQPEDVTLFHGAVDPDKLNFLARMAIKNVKAPVGDFRDWDAIDAWAEEIARALAVAQPASAGS